MIDTIKTVTHIAKPADSRCKWWQAELRDLSPLDLIEKKELDYYKRGQDLELAEGVFLIDSEANHHRHSRGYTVLLGVVLGDSVKWLSPSAKIKQLIKSEGYQDLMLGSGDVVACYRIALYLSRQGNISEAFEKLKQLE